MRRDVRWRAARLACAALALLTFHACRRDPRPNLVLISIDALRSDRLSIYGCPRLTSPNLDAWARRRAIVCDDARTHAPWTLPAHTSLLTGLDPLHHAANWAYRPAPQSLETVAERLRAAGYTTAGITGGGWMDQAFGLAQGFERYEALRGADGRGDREWEQHSRLAAEWLRTLPEPFFLFVHTFDVHDFPRAKRVPPGTPDDERGRMYEEAVRHMDTQLALLLAELESPRLRDHTAVVFTADHGEAMGELHEYNHNALYEFLLHVPLIVQPPGPPGAERRRLGSLVRHVDIVPTLLEWAGVAAVPQLDGLSLVPRLNAPAAAGPSEAIAYFPLGHGFALRQGRLKYFLDDSAFTAPDAREAFHDLDVDPGEAHSQPQDARVAALRARALELLQAGLQGLALTIEVPAGRDIAFLLRGQPVQGEFARRPMFETPPLVRLNDDAARWTLPHDTRATLVFDVIQQGQLEISTADGAAVKIDLAALPASPSWKLGGASIRAEWRGTPHAPAPALDPEVAERLRALGYLH